VPELRKPSTIEPLAGPGGANAEQATGYEAIKMNFQVRYHSIFDLVATSQQNSVAAQAGFVRQGAGQVRAL